MTEDEPPRPTPRGLTRGEGLIIVGAIVAGLLMLFAYRWTWSAPEAFSEEWGWVEGVLLNVGSAVLLVAPIEWFSSRMRVRVADVDTRQTEATEKLSAQVKTLDAQVEDLADFQEKLSARQAERRADDERLFRALRTAAPNRATVVDALNRAAERKLISPKGVRVPVAKRASLRLSFPSDSPPSQLPAVLEYANGQAYERFLWEEGQDVFEFFERIADAVEAAQEPLNFDAEYVFEQLSETLTVAAAHDHARPIIEYFPGQWAMTDHAIVSTNNVRYTVDHDATNRLDLPSHVLEKPWVDENSFQDAWTAGVELFPITPAQNTWALRRRAEQNSPN